MSVGGRGRLVFGERVRAWRLPGARPKRESDGRGGTLAAAGEAEVTTEVAAATAGLSVATNAGLTVAALVATSVGTDIMAEEKYLVTVTCIEFSTEYSTSNRLNKLAPSHILSGKYN